MDQTHQIYSAKQKPAKKHILRLTSYLLNTCFLHHVSIEILDQQKFWFEWGVTWTISEKLPSQHF